MLLSILALGFLIGMQHALEADHVAAVASLVDRENRVGGITRYGAFWGMGHTLTLLFVAGGAVVLGIGIGELFASGVELAVGVMLVLLGGRLLWRMRRERIHFHVHHHGDGRWHLHAHSHAGERTPHDPHSHHHTHPDGLPWKALLVGLMHGLAGSAPLVLLVATSLGSPLLALLYIAIFGAGSIVGMAVLSTALAVPLVWSARFTTRLNLLLRIAIGVAAMAIGLDIAGTSAAALFAG